MYQLLITNSFMKYLEVDRYINFYTIIIRIIIIINDNELKS